MAGRQRATFQKRQKEAKRREKQKMKVERRTARREERARKRAPDVFGNPPPDIDFGPHG